MSKEDLNQEEEVETTPATESESDDATELNDLFADDDSDDSDDYSDDDSEEDRLAKLERKFEKKMQNIQKGVNKFFSEQGRKAKQEVKTEKKEEVKTVPTDDISELFYAQIPQAELVQDDLKQIAETKYGGSILKAWRNETWIQDKSKALADAKKVEEENKSKIDKPKSGAGSNRTDFSKVSEKDIATMSPKEKSEYFDYMVKKEKGSLY